MTIKPLNSALEILREVLKQRDQSEEKLYIDASLLAAVVAQFDQAQQFTITTGTTSKVVTTQDEPDVGC